MFRVLSSPIQLVSSNTCTTKISSFLSKRLASTLIISEPITSSSSTALPAGTLSAITAAKKIPNNDTIDILVFTNSSSLSDETKLPSGINQIYTVKDVYPLAENISNAILKTTGTYDYIVSCSTKFGSNVLPRIASNYDASPVTDIIDIIDGDTFIRPMYAGNALSKVKNNDSIKCLSIRTTAFDKCVEEDNSNKATITELEVDATTSIEHVQSNVSENTGRAELTSASIVISGGRGMKNGENFKLLDDLATKFGNNITAIGASRAAVDAGYVPNDLQVGQTGKVVAPNLYLAVGISGAIQHLSGMKDSKVIVAINSDKEAPIFNVADYGLVDDLFKVVPELTDKI